MSSTNPPEDDDSRRSHFPGNALQEKARYACYWPELELIAMAAFKHAVTADSSLHAATVKPRWIDVAAE
jgi:hypothetical protein